MKLIVTMRQDVGLATVTQNRITKYIQRRRHGVDWGGHVHRGHVHPTFARGFS